MAVTPLRHIVDDIEVDLKQTLDDRTITKPQIAYYVLLIANRLKAQHIEKRDSGAFLSTYVDIPIVTETTSENPNKVKNRKHFLLPKCIYDYNEDRGIDYISYSVDEDCELDVPRFTKIKFNRTTPSKSEILYYNGYTEPNPSNPYFYRIGDYIYLLGVEKVDVKKVEIGIYTTFDPVTTIKLDDPFDFPEELLAILKRQVLDLGRFSLLLPQERINDGDDSIQNTEVPTQKLVSVNELNQEENK